MQNCSIPIGRDGIGAARSFAMENEKSLLDEEDATELPERDALSIIDPSRMGGALVPTVAPVEPAEIGPTDVGQPTG
jgi:hypothetical protein